MQSQSHSKLECFIEIDKMILKHIWKNKGHGRTKATQRNEQKNQKESKIYYNTTVIHTAWSCQKGRQIEQYSRIGSTEINLHIDGQMIFKDARAIQWGTENLFTKWCCNNRTSTWGKKRSKKRKEINLYIMHKHQKLILDGSEL